MPPKHVPVRAAPANPTVRVLARQAFSRVAGAPLIGGNAVDLLIDGRANFDAWLASIRAARSSVLFENYIFGDDHLAREFREALVERAAAGVRVCVVRDWLGSLGEASNHFWAPLRAAGGEVRTYNPIHFTSPLGWLSRDHRKLLVVDSEIAFVSGVCVSARWLGEPTKGIPPWRDTGVAIRGPAVREMAIAFAENWARLGDALPEDVPALQAAPAPAGEVDLRVVATLPSTTGLYRLDQMIAAIAQKTLWLTDAYFVGTSAYVQGLVSAARDGVDVRLLVPGTSDLPGVGALSRAGYRPLLEAGIRIFEWNGSMLHAKTAVADGRWARIGSSNLNLASWMGNCEIDVSVENTAFAERMQALYEEDLGNATEVVLDGRRARRRPRPRGGPKGQSSGRAAAGAMRIANAMGAAIAERRVLASSEGSTLAAGGFGLTIVAIVASLWPRVVAWPLAAVALWFAISLFTRFLSISARAKPPPEPVEAPPPPS